MQKRNLYIVKEKIFKKFFLLTDFLKTIATVIYNFTNFIFICFSFFFIALFIFHIGFYTPSTYSFNINETYKIIFYGLFLAKCIMEVANYQKKKWYIRSFDILILLFSMLFILYNYVHILKVSSLQQLFSGNKFLIVMTIIIISTELNKLFKLINTLAIPPALLFVLSFLFVIFIGSGLLLLPNAHQGNLSLQNALFTSTSAVCVTGLIVVDTSTAFTLLGKIIILALIQVGALGIMTFTGFFSYIFTGSATFKERILLKDMLSSENIGNLFNVLIKIITLTFIIEIIGAVIIYFNISQPIESKVFFSIFHSISAFCNAGFSTLPEGLYTETVRNSFGIHIIVGILIILGGIGFPVLLSIYKYVKFLIRSSFSKIYTIHIHRLKKKDMHTSIVLSTTGVLIIFGMLSYYFLEKDSFEGFSFFQKTIVTFFGSVTARTAGFNIVDITKWSYPTIFIMILLMWIGASPGSTGGGIKTTTFAIALRSTFSFLRGRKHFELHHREIGHGTINRVLAIIFLSVLIIFTGFLGLLITDPLKNPVHLLFESFSAFGTVGLSLVNTGTLSENGKWIVILLMFIGRVGPITLLSGIFISNKIQYYRYPIQDVIIN